MNIGSYQNHCCGCGECFAICPVQAITMTPSKEGFIYPVVDESKCIHCSKCINRCTFNCKNPIGNQGELLGVYAVKHTNPEIRAASRSGGVFTALSDIILDAGGVVYGCKLLNCCDAVHVRATTKEERDAMRGSKYIQSKTYGIFVAVKNDLKSGRWVLFSGTACQVHAVADFCKDVDCSKLLLVDIVCHGVPSPKVWADYLQYLSKVNNKQIAAVDFRDKKKFGWADHRETVLFTDGSEFSGNIFKDLFFSHYVLRKACFACPYKNLHRVGDITIADCWGIAQHYSEFDDNKGVSLVLVNTEKGTKFFGQLKETENIPVDIEKLMQPSLKKNWDVPTGFDAFWKFYHSHSFSKVIDKYVLKKECYAVRVLKKIKTVLRRVENNFIHRQ